jgi:hypothetical protein
MDLIKLICLNTQYADMATKQIVANGYIATAINRAVVTDQEVGNSLSKIIVEAHAYTDRDVTQFDIDCFIRAKTTIESNVVKHNKPN